VGTVELEPEVTAWLDGLADDELGHAERYIDLPADQGALLGEPFTRQLDGKLRELRFYLGRQQTRITYYIATGRNIVLHGVRQDQTERTNRDRPRPASHAALHRRRPLRHRGGLTMNSRTTWDEMKARRADSSQRHRGYDSAGRAIRLASEIRTLQEKKGLSQRQLAKLVGTTQSAIARLEGGRISPSLPTLDRIAAALGAEVTVTITDTAELAT